MTGVLRITRYHRRWKLPRAKHLGTKRPEIDGEGDQWRGQDGSGQEKHEPHSIPEFSRRGQKPIAERRAVTLEAND